MKSRLLKRLSVRSLRRRNNSKTQTKQPSMEQCIVEKDDDESSSHSLVEEEEESLQDSIPRVVTTSPMDTPSPIRECAMQEFKQQQQVERIAKAAAALDNYGNTLFEQGEYGNAMASYSKALRLKKRTLKSLHDEESTQSDDHHLGHSQSALLASVATSINNIGYLRQRSGANADETMAAYKDSLRIKTRILGRDSLSVGKTLNNIGSVHFLKKDYNKAMEAYREAHAIMSLNLGRHHLDVATVCSNIGDVHLARNDTDTAREKYREALETRWELLGERDPKVIRLLEKIALLEMGELEQAQELGCKRDDKMEDETDQQDLLPFDNLMREVKRDMRHVDNVKRQLAIDMVKEKLQMRREIRAINEGVEIIGGSQDDPHSPTKAPLSPNDRTHALQSVKERLAALRELRNEDGSPKRNHDDDDDDQRESRSGDEPPVDKVAVPTRDFDALRLVDTNAVEEKKPEATETVKERLERLRASSKLRHEEQQENNICALGQSSRERAVERHRQATENVKERLERLRAKQRMHATCVKFERDGINALRRMNIKDTMDTKQELVEL